MAAPCSACGSKHYHRLRMWMEDGKIKEACSQCMFIRMTPCYDDIYLGPSGGLKTEENICDKKTGQPIPFHTKQDKAIAMRMAGVKQSVLAERNHGMRNESHLNRKIHFEVRQ